MSPSGDIGLSSSTGRAFSPPRGLPTSTTGRGGFFHDGVGMRRDGSDRGRAGYNGSPMIQDSYGRPSPTNDGYGHPSPTNDVYGRLSPVNDTYGRPYQDGYGRPSPTTDGYYAQPSKDGYYRDGYDGQSPQDGYSQDAYVSPSQDAYYGRPSQDMYTRPSQDGNRPFGRPSPENFQMTPAFYDKRDPSPAQRKKVGFNF
ncbi:UNVERIFIED_CONTAM: hypothetical protein HDU68_011831 [Siphonaria sp. JEL0065]|nr:hypothetical protein HDU68_011831 [Siphonaria sp. JEL0065]